jgi:hypothetical protein
MRSPGRSWSVRRSQGSRSRSGNCSQLRGHFVETNCSRLLLVEHRLLMSKGHGVKSDG